MFGCAHPNVFSSDISNDIEFRMLVHSIYIQSRGRGNGIINGGVESWEWGASYVVAHMCSCKWMGEGGCSGER